MNTENSTEKYLALLLELQQVDGLLGELERSKVYLPDMIRHAEEQLQQEEHNVHESEQKLEELEREKRRLEVEIEAARESLEASRKRMKTIKTNKEYDAITAEIEHQKNKIAVEEEDLLRVMEEIDTTRELAAQYKEAYGANRVARERQLKALQSEIDSIEDKIKARMAERQALFAQIPRRVSSVYERVRKGKGDSAVVMVKKRSCGGCFKQLPPHRVQEIKRKDRILTCDSCGRILVWNEESD